MDFARIMENLSNKNSDSHEAEKNEINATRHALQWALFDLKSY
jgi:hypothetical protein